jgi:hypothetical protein
LSNDDDAPHPPKNTLADAERFPVREPDGKMSTFVVIASAQLDGIEVALLADEAEIGSPSDDMGLYVYGVRDEPVGRALFELADDDEERYYQHFAELMGLPR